MYPAILTLDEYKAFANIPTSQTDDDAEISVLLNPVSETIRKWTERDFAAPAVTEERLFPYTGDGVLDIDDAVAITALLFEVPHGSDYALSSDFWTPMPFRRDDSEVFNYILLPEGWFGGLNIAMGFTSNLDVYVNDYGWPATPVTVKVTGTWGWPVVPEDVKLAAFWTIQNWKESSPSDNLTAESIESYSRQWGAKAGAGGVTANLAIPNRARDILISYQKQLV